MAYALGPDQKGKVVWEFRAGKGTALGGILWSMAVDKETLACCSRLENNGLDNPERNMEG